MILRCDQESLPNPPPTHNAARPDPATLRGKRRIRPGGRASDTAVPRGSIPLDLEAPENFSSLPVAAIDPLALLDRLPLADAVLRLGSYVLDPATLQRIFHEHRGRSFEQILTFPTFVQLIGDALLQHHGSGRQSFQRASEHGILDTSIAAAYGKLRRVPRALSLGFFDAISTRIQELFPEAASAWETPESLRDLNPIILDGKTLKKVAKRLKATRAALGKISGGKLLVALAPQSGLSLTMAADLDGEANEASLVPAVLPRVAAHVPEHRLWIADRQFGDPVQIERFLSQPGDHVLVRWDGRTSFHADPERPAVTGRDPRGRTVIQEWGWYGAASNPRRRYLRRITLLRPGEETVVLMTDLLDEQQYPADDFLKGYLQRWGIERVFQEITEVFALEHLIGSTAQATIFQAAFCLVLYNLIQVVRAYIVSGRPEVSVTGEVSSEQIFYDVRRQMIAVSELVSVPELTACLERSWSREEMCGWLKQRLGGLWTARWTKAVNKKPRPKKPAVGSCYGAHDSVHRLVQRHKAANKSP